MVETCLSSQGCHAQEVPRLYRLCEEPYENQKAQDRQIAGLRSFAKHVERFLAQTNQGATSPSNVRPTSVLEQASVPLEYARPPMHLQTPKPPAIPAPPVPKDETPPLRENAPSPGPSKGSTTHFSTVRSEVRSGAIRIDITDPEQWSAGDVAVIRNQEAKKVRDIGSLIFETPITHNCEAGVEVRSLLPTEQLEEIDGRLAVLDVDPYSGTRFVRFWVDEIPLSKATGNHVEEGGSNIPAMSRDASRTPVTPERRERGSPIQETTESDRSSGSPDFGGGVDYRGYKPLLRERIPMGGSSSAEREHIPNNERMTPPRVNQPRTPPEDQNPRGCSLHSMEPLRDWFCKGADMTSAAEYEAALCQLEDDPPDIRQYTVNIREERWTNFFSLEGVRLPAMTVDVIQRGEAIAIFERETSSYTFNRYQEPQLCAYEHC